MTHWGINALNHGSSIAVINGQQATTITSDSDQLSRESIRQALDYHGAPDRIFWYERPWVKKARQIYAGQYKTAFNMDNLPSVNLRKWGLGYAPVTYTAHHASHAAAGYYTSPFTECAVVVLDAIGEFECASIWVGSRGKLNKVWSRSYPHSLGLFYSAFTQFVGLTPIRDEHLLQQMAAQGCGKEFLPHVRRYFNPGELNSNTNFHRGVLTWDMNQLTTLQQQCDLAAAVQIVFEEQLCKIMELAMELTGSNSLVYMGGCAMNSMANKRVVEPRFRRIWSLPNPGDASSAMGAVLYHTKQFIWKPWEPVKHIAIKL